MDTPGQRLRKFRENAKLSAAQLAERVGRSESAVRNQENGTNGIPAVLAKKYAAALGTTAAAILYGDDAPGARMPDPEMMIIRRRVQAGAFLRAEDLDQAPPRRYPAARDPRFNGVDQWLSEVVGDSMNALAEPAPILDGDLIHCIDAIGSGYAPRTGDVVEAEMLRFGGREIEVSVKQVAVTRRGDIELWPRSDNPNYQAPLKFGAGQYGGEDVEVRICGLVVNLIRRFGR